MSETETARPYRHITTKNCFVCKDAIPEGKRIRSGHVLLNTPNPFADPVKIGTSFHKECCPDKVDLPYKWTSDGTRSYYNDRQGCFGLWEPEMGVMAIEM